MNEVIYFTITALLLYVAADKALDTVERMRGARFENRSMIFFAIIVVLSIGTFEILQRMLPTQQAPAAVSIQEAAPTAAPAATEEPQPAPAEEPRVKTD